MQADMKIWFDELQVTDINGCRMNPAIGVMLKNKTRLFQVTGLCSREGKRSGIELQEVKLVNEEVAPGITDQIMKPVEDGLKQLGWGEFKEFVEDGRLVFK